MNKALKRLISTMGTLSGVVAIEHAIGAILQGNHAPESIVFASWPDEPFFAPLNGEPAMSLIPNFLIGGILTTLLAVMFIIWVTHFVPHRYGSLVIFLLSIAILLTGGGFGPPVLGMIVGIASVRMHTQVHRSNQLPGRRQHLYARIWPWSFNICIVAWIFLFPGIPTLNFVFGINQPILTSLIILLAFGFLGLSIITGDAHDVSTILDRSVMPPVSPKIHPHAHHLRG